MGQEKKVMDEFEQEQLRQKNKPWYEEFVTPEQYIEFKLTMLRKDMFIEPTDKEIARLREKKTETGINNVVKSIIARHWSGE